jgi:hypothetical protein
VSVNIHFNVVNIVFSYQVNDKYEKVGVTFASTFIREKVYNKIKSGVEKELFRNDLCQFINTKDQARGEAWNSRMNDFFEEFCFEFICKGES